MDNKPEKSEIQLRTKLFSIDQFGDIRYAEAYIGKAGYHDIGSGEQIFASLRASSVYILATHFSRLERFLLKVQSKKLTFKQRASSEIS